eukprot:2390937-Lingulodinium_polyedra.AAC.1
MMGMKGLPSQDGPVREVSAVADALPKLLWLATLLQSAAGGAATNENQPLAPGLMAVSMSSATSESTSSGCSALAVAIALLT